MFSSKANTKSAPIMAESSAYDFKVKDIDGVETDLSKFKGKVSLIVNVASACGLTKQNYQASVLESSCKPLFAEGSSLDTGPVTHMVWSDKIS
jgi:hypothetical protein